MIQSKIIGKPSTLSNDVLLYDIIALLNFHNVFFYIIHYNGEVIILGIAVNITLCAYVVEV